MATEESFSAKNTTTISIENSDHKSTTDGGLKMKIMRNKNDIGSDAKHKIVKTDSTNGLESSPKPNNGSSNSAKNKPKETKAAQCESPSPVQKIMLNDGETIPSALFTAKSVPVSNLFSTHTPKYALQCNSVGSNLSDDVGQSVNKGFSSPGPPKRNRKDESAIKSPENSNGVLKGDGCSAVSKKKKGYTTSTVDRCVGTSFGTLTEPECLGPCEPGTSVNLDGIVWHETGDGILVVNATWRGRSYVGTLLDSTRHEWAPPRPNDGNEDWDCRTRAGRAKRRNATYGPDLNNSLTPRPRQCNKPRGSFTSDTATVNTPKPSSPRPDIRKSRDDASSNDESSTSCLVNPVTGLQVEIPNVNRQTIAPCPVSPVLLECPDSDCNKKYKNTSGLRYHQSRVHGADCYDEESRHSFDTPLTPLPPQESSKSAELVSLDEESIDDKNGNDSVSSSTLDHFAELKTDTTNTKSIADQNCDKDEENPIKQIADSIQCDNEVVSSSSPSREIKATVTCSTNAFISVKRDIFETHCPKDLKGDGMNSTEHKSQFMLSLLNTDYLSLQDSPLSPAYSDISDDSMSFSSSDFIDKLIKSTENKNSNMELGEHFSEMHPFEAKNDQKYLIVENTDIKAPITIHSAQNMQSGENSKDKSSIKASLLIAGNLPGQISTSSSTFINPYNLVSSDGKSSATITTEDQTAVAEINTIPVKKENTSPNLADNHTNPTITDNQNATELGDSSATGQISASSGTATTQAESIKPKLELKELENNGKSINESIQSNEIKQETKYQVPCASSQSSNNKSNNQQTSRSFSTASNSQYGIKQEPPKKHSPGNFSRNTKDEKNIKVKQEPQMSLTSRPTGPIQYMSHAQYMNPPNFGFNPGFQQYQNNFGPGPAYSLPYYNTPLPRYTISNEQSKQNITPQYIPSHPFGAANFSAPSTLSSFPSPQPNPISTIANSASVPQRLDQSRMQSGPPNGRTSAQTHFHTHHHTHVGLGYPMYAPSYEAGVLPSQQGAPSPMSPFPSRPAK